MVRHDARAVGELALELVLQAAHHEVDLEGRHDGEARKIGAPEAAQVNKSLPLQPRADDVPAGERDQHGVHLEAVRLRAPAGKLDHDPAVTRSEVDRLLTRPDLGKVDHERRLLVRAGVVDCAAGKGEEDVQHEVEYGRGAHEPDEEGDHPLPSRGDQPDARERETETRDARPAQLLAKHETCQQDRGAGIQRADHRRDGQHPAPAREKEGDVRAHVEEPRCSNEGQPPAGEAEGPPGEKREAQHRQNGGRARREQGPQPRSGRRAGDRREKKAESRPRGRAHPEGPAHLAPAIRLHRSRAEEHDRGQREADPDPRESTGLSPPATPNSTGIAVPTTAATGEATATTVVARAVYRSAIPTAPHNPAAAPQAKSCKAGSGMRRRSAAGITSSRPKS